MPVDIKGKTIHLDGLVGLVDRHENSFFNVDVREALATVGDENRALIRINSPGGSCSEGLAIYETLRRHPGGVDVYVDYACSIASVIAMAGIRRTMAQFGRLMIHQAHATSWGRADDLRKLADELDRYNRDLVQVYQERTRRPADEIEDWMREERWFDAEEALKAGFIDAIDRRSKAKPTMALAAWMKNPPHRVMRANYATVPEVWARRSRLMRCATYSPELFRR